jgi:siroheme synthase
MARFLAWASEYADSLDATGVPAASDWDEKTVVRLKCGDPMIFARGAEEWEHLSRHGIEVEIVPGVSSSMVTGAAGSSVAS